MDISAELDRIFPVPLPEADLTKASDELFKFLSGLSKEEFETAITLLPDKPKLEFEDKEQTHGQYLMPDYHVTTVKTVFWDAIVQYTIIAYIGYVSATDIISHLLKRKKAKPGTGLRSLANKVSPRLRFQLFEHLLSLEDKDARSRPFTEGEFEDYIENQFGGGRIGMVEYALEELLDTYKNLSKKNKTRSTITGRLEHHILARIQQRRRGEFSSRLGKIDSVNKARFAAEEVKRELYVYRTFDPIYVSELSAKIYTWYDKSAARAKVVKNPSVLHYSKPFEEFLRIARLIRLAVSNKISDISDYLKPQWNYVIAKFLPSESFWHSMQGLNGEIPLEHTEAGRNIATYRMWAKVAGAVYVAVILLPFAVAVGVRAPGAVVSAIRWTGGKLLLGTQYVYTTIKVFGLTGGGVRIVSDVYHFYLRNPITINQVVTTGTEIILDLTGNGTGMTPGSSPADLATDATQKVGKIAKAGISKLTDEVASAGRGSVGEIEMVEMIVKGQDGNNFYRIEASIKGGEDSVLKLKVDKHENLGKQIDLARQKEILFHGKARNDNSIADARGTAAHAASTDVSALAAADDINVQQLAATGTHGGVVTMGPKVTTPGKPIIGNTKSIDGSGASRNARHTSDNGAGSASRLNGATSKKPPKLKIDLKKPDAMKKLANADATSEDVVNVLKDPLLFKIYKTSLATSKAEAIQALNDIAELGGVIARFTMRTQSGLVRAEKIISDAVWALPGHLRGVLIEHALSPTQYKDWFRVGQLDRGFFPDIDFALFKNGLDQRVSVKTVDPFAKGFEKQISDTLPEHLETLVSGTINGRGRGHNITALLDVRMPLGTGVPRADLLKTLNDLIPKDIKKWVSVVVDEF